MLNLALERNMKIKEIVKEVATIANYVAGKTAEVDDPEHGTKTTLDLTNPNTAQALKPNDNGQLEFDPDSQAGTANPATTAQPITNGTQVAVKTDEEMGEEPPAHLSRKPRYEYQPAPKGSDWQAHHAAQMAARAQYAGASKADFETSMEIANPHYNPNDDTSEEPDTIDVGVDYDYTVSGSYQPATWGYHGGEPEEHPEVEFTVNRVVDLDTGEDITKTVDIDAIIAHLNDTVEISGDDDFEEDVGGDPTDEFIDDVRDKEFEKKATGQDMRSADDVKLEAMLRIAGLR